MDERPNALTDIILAVFRVNGRLLAKGDELVGPLNLTSARWQVLGAVALAVRPTSAPQIAEPWGSPARARRSSSIGWKPRDSWRESPIRAISDHPCIR